MAAVVGAALCAGISSVQTRKHAKGLHPATFTAPAMLLGALLLEGWALARGEAVALPSSAVAWASVLYLAVFGSVIGFLLYFWLLPQWGPTRSSLLTLFTPIVALALGAAFLGEALAWTSVAGTALVLAGVAVAGRGPAATKAAVAPPPALPAVPDPALLEAAGK
jgi:drug/metabolite transporter (DMT)-like permease